MARRKKLVKGVWSKNEVKLLKSLFPNKSTKDAANELKRGVKSVEMKASKLGLRKTKKYLKSLGRK